MDWFRDGDFLMEFFAELNEDNIVIRVIAVHDNELLDEDNNTSEQKGVDFCIAHYGGTWIQTSDDPNFRKNYAGINYIYDSVRDAFINKKPYPSWILNESTCKWESPTPYPTDDKDYIWDEATLSWIEF